MKTVYFLKALNNFGLDLLKHLFKISALFFKAINLSVSITVNEIAVGRFLKTVFFRVRHSQLIEWKWI